MEIRQRNTAMSIPAPTQSLTSGALHDKMTTSDSWVFLRQPVWIVLAVSSGACAALNGVFAKLTTTSSTSTLATNLAKLLGMSSAEKPLEVLIRGSFFGLNLLFNAIMWALFTAALTRATSTTRVSIINVSANFFVTAVAGWLVFGEEMKGLWWGGASLLVVGNVVIGRREEGEKPGGTVGLDETRGEAEGLMGGDREGEEEEDLLELGDHDGRSGYSGVAHERVGVQGGVRPRSPFQQGDSQEQEQARLRQGIEVDAPL